MKRSEVMNLFKSKKIKSIDAGSDESKCYEMTIEFSDGSGMTIGLGGSIGSYLEIDIDLEINIQV